MSQKGNISDRTLAWADKRYNLNSWIEFFRKKRVPVSHESLWYYFGGVSLFLFIIQVLSGVLLLMYYNADPDRAFESIRFLMSDVDFGWLIRSVHSWSANLMVLAVFIHMFSVFFTRAYRPPRELTWVTGLMLLLMALGFGFSGYLLPWNELAFFATKVGTDIAGSVPVIGEAMLVILRGGEDVTGATLSRFFGIHVAIMPLIFTAILSVHLLFVQLQGMSEPLEWEEKGAAGKPVEMKQMPFFPNFALRDLLLWLIVLNVLAILAVFFPWELGIKADAFASAPAGIKPEWYFMFMFETLKLIPAHVLAIEGELFGIMMFGLAIFLWMLVPFIDTRVKIGRKNRHLIRGAKFWVFYIIYMTVLGYWDTIAGWISGMFGWFGMGEEGMLSIRDGVLSIGGALRLVSMVIAAIAGVIIFLWSASIFRRVIMYFIRRRKAKAVSAAVVALALLGSAGEVRAQNGVEPDNYCIECHAEQEDELLLPVELIGDDVHTKSELSCADCHGGDQTSDDPDEAMFDADNWRGVPERDEIVDFCGRCHSDPEYMRRFNPALPVDQVEKYYTSRHGMALREGDTNVAVCSDCHTAHGIRKASDPKSSIYPKNIPDTCDRCHGDEELMNKYGIRAQQYSDYKSSVHGEALYVKGDIGAPVCNDCHGNHGAMPPGVDDVSFVCGLCHVNNFQLFEKSPMGIVFHEAGKRACEECHSNHAIKRPNEEMLDISSGESICAECHDSSDEGGMVAASMYSMIESLHDGYNETEDLVHQAEQKGVEVSDAVLSLGEAHQSYLQARTRIHSFNVEYVGEEVDKGKAKVAEARKIGEAAIHEFSKRKWGLGISTLFITILAVALWFKIKEIERKQAARKK